MAWIFTSDGNYVNFNGGGNLWRLHKDSNCISWHWDESGDLFFDVYDQEYTVKAGNIADVVIDGVPLSAASGFPTAIRAVFTGLSSGSGYLVAEVTLTDAQIKTLPSIPVEVIPAPGAGKINLITACCCILNTTAGGYIGVADASLSLKNNALNIDLNIPALTQVGLQTPGHNFYQLSIPYISEGAGTFVGQEVTQEFLVSTLENQAIVITDYWAGVSNYTGGNAANTLKVKAYYVVVDL